MITPALAFILFAQSQAQPPVDIPPHTVEAVTVEANRSAAEGRRAAVSAFVRGLAEPTRRGRLARWNRGVCPAVVGLPERYGRYIADRIAQEAATVGIEADEPGCVPNILILVTDQPDRAAADLRSRFTGIFAVGGRHAQTETAGGRDRFNAFLTSTAPVRWWHVARQKQADGRPLATWELEPGLRVSAATGVNSSRLGSLWREDLARAIIIVDTGKVRGATYDHLGAYLAMVALAQVASDADPGSLPTILTVFDDLAARRPAAESLTEWDRAYLRGLYGAPGESRNLNSQRGAIRRSMVKARTAPD